VLVVSTNAADARIEVDGKVVAESAANARIELERQGEHQVLVTAPGKRPFKKTVTIAAGAQLELPVNLLRLASPKPKGSGNKDYMLDPFGNKRVR
jgi:hypothetical protein